MPQSVPHKTVYTGYLRREADPKTRSSAHEAPIDGPYLLVTSGGGGDGEALVDWVLRAYELREPMAHPALIVLGPFMPSDAQNAFLERVNRLLNVEAITFDPGMESLIQQSVGLVAMGGYNTFCEILSFDKPALIVPRSMPRREQLIRTQRADELGLVKCLEADDVRDAKLMATALQHLPQQRRPSEVVVPGLLDGLENVNRLADRIIAGRAKQPVALGRQNG